MTNTNTINGEASQRHPRGRTEARVGPPVPNRESARGLHSVPKTRAGSIRNHVPLHAQGHGAHLRLQVNPEAEAALQGGLRRRVEGDSDNAPPLRAAQRGAHPRHLRGRRLRPPRHGALRGRRALRQDCAEGTLQRATGRQAHQDHC